MLRAPTNAQGFLGHEHLAVARVSDYDVVVPYHGVDGLQCV